MDDKERQAARAILIAKLRYCDPEVQQYVFDALRDMENEDEDEEVKDEKAGQK